MFVIEECDLQAVPALRKERRIGKVNYIKSVERITVDHTGNQGTDTRSGDQPSLKIRKSEVFR